MPFYYWKLKILKKSVTRGVYGTFKNLTLDKIQDAIGELLD